MRRILVAAVALALVAVAAPAASAAPREIITAQGNVYVVSGAVDPNAANNFR